jgi:NADH-quinone oxidoreductase subunit E
MSVRGNNRAELHKENRIIRGDTLDKGLDTSAEKAFAYTAENEKKLQSTLKMYPTKMAALLPALWLGQKQKGHLTDEILEYIANRLEISPVHVFSVVEFYTMYHRKPPGKYHLQLCRTLSCYMLGAETVQDHITKKLGIGPGEKTEDGLFSLELVECLGSCGTAPVMRVNDIYCENLTPERINEIIEGCKAGRSPEEAPEGAT